MSDCCEPEILAPEAAADAARVRVYKQALWVVLAINATMFVVEMAAGVWGRSVALQADALDFLGDTATYGITLVVLGMSLRRRAAVAMLKGAAMCSFGVWVVGVTLYHLIVAPLPSAPIMGSTAALALVANVTSAMVLFRHRAGDANMRSVWLCTRNDAFANIAVIAAGGGVWATGSGWPDLAVGTVIAALALSGGLSVLRQSAGEWRAAAPAAE